MIVKLKRLSSRTKVLLLVVASCLMWESVMAQRIHSFGLSLNLTEYSYPKGWRGNDDIIIEKLSPLFKQFPNLDAGISGYYSYRNQFNFYVAYSIFDHSARYKDKTQIPPKFIEFRQGGFVDFLLGYNFAKRIIKNQSINKQLNLWVQAGVCYSFYRTEQSYISYDPSLEGTIHNGIRHEYYSPGTGGEYRPVGQLMIQFAPLKHWFVQSAFNYRYLLKDWQPVSVVFGLGYKL